MNRAEQTCLDRCNGACCRNTHILLSDVDELRNLSGDTPVRWLHPSDFDKLIFPSGPESTVIYACDGPQSGEASIDIKMQRCPRLDPDTRRCMWHDDPRRPDACRMMPVGGTYCNDRRYEEGLFPIEQPKD